LVIGFGEESPIRLMYAFLLQNV
jgi:hypothetical protein